MSDTKKYKHIHHVVGVGTITVGQFSVQQNQLFF